MKVTALAGGVGGAKLLIGLQRAVDDLTAIVNTGDDTHIYGVHVSPDVDIVTYWLAGIADIERGWGIEGDTFHVIEAMRSMGAEAWFNLGDRDFATCLLRTERMRDGEPLSAITADIKDRLGVVPQIIPMTDDEVATRIVTTSGTTLEFQEYFVRERQEPEVTEVRFAGIADARPAPGVIEAIRTADLVVICPSNPVVSVDPILSLPGVREELTEHPHVTAVTPIVQGAPIKGPADKLLRAKGIEVSARGVAGMYAGMIDRFVLDDKDEQQAIDVEALDIETLVTDTLMSGAESSERLARVLL